MKKILIAIFLTLLFVSPVWAVSDVTLAWDAVPGATGYKLYQSIDGGVTWTAPTDVGNVTTKTLTGVSDTVFILWKVSAYNAVAEAVSHWQGAWYDGRKKPPVVASGLGVK